MGWRLGLPGARRVKASPAALNSSPCQETTHEAEGIMARSESSAPQARTNCSLGLLTSCQSSSRPPNTHAP